MEFWGVEVKAGKPLKVTPDDEIAVHISHASLGEVKKGKENDPVLLFVDVNGKKHVLGTLSSENCRQISYDLFFKEEFELSHNLKNGSVYFCGYTAFIPDSSDEEKSTDSDSEELPVIKGNVKPEPKKVLSNKTDVVKPESTFSKSIAAEDDTTSDDEDEGDSSDQSSPGASSDEDDASSDEDDDTPEKAKLSNKRASESASKKPADKKAKLETPQKTGANAKNGSVHIATPYPSKRAGKAPANSDKSKQQTPKLAGQVSRNSHSKIKV